MLGAQRYQKFVCFSSPPPPPLSLSLSLSLSIYLSIYIYILTGVRDEVVNLIVAVPRARNGFISGKLTETRDASQSEFEFSRNSVMIGANFATTYVTHAQVPRDVC